MKAKKTISKTKSSSVKKYQYAGVANSKDTTSLSKSNNKAIKEALKKFTSNKPKKSLGKKLENASYQDVIDGISKRRGGGKPKIELKRGGMFKAKLSLNKSTSKRK